MSKEEVVDVSSWNVYQRILGIMSELSYIQKGDKQVNNQYRYVSHDQVTAKLHPLLVKYRVLMIPSVDKHTQEGNRTMVEQFVYVVNVDRPEDQFMLKTFGYGVDSGDKGPGKAMSYAFKMAALKALSLETGEDSDHDQKSVYEPAKCLDFDLGLPKELSEVERKQVDKFIAETAEAHGKHVEEIKAKALGNMEQFLEVFKKWNTGKKKAK